MGLDTEKDFFSDIYGLDDDEVNAQFATNFGVAYGLVRKASFHGTEAGEGCDSPISDHGKS